MQSKFFTLAVLLCVFCTASILTSCTEFKASSELISDEDASLEKRSKLRSRSVGSWSSREIVGSATLFNSANGYLHGPIISQSNIGNNYISWRVHSDLNPQTGKYINGTTSVMHGGQFSGWLSDSPIPAFHQVGSTLPEIIVNDLDGGAYAVWVFNGNVYASVYSPVTRWGQPVLLGTGEEAWLTSNGNAGIVAVWRQQLAFNQFSINAKRHQFGDTWSSQTGMTRTAVFVNAAHPVMDLSGQVLFAWQEETPGQRGVYSASFNSLNWSQLVSVRTPKPLGSELIVGIRLASPAQTGQAQLLLQVTDSISGDGIFAYQYAQGFWQSEQNIDRNAFVSDRTQLEPFGFATNDRGNMIVAWIEEQTDNINYFSSVYAARYTPG
ncbi:MAG: hypothetical protein OEX19_05330, partial [Gammaproteobacteria bacterium]|nr:hypothetical protein [Gammaproteobacteria bacterium]